MVTLKLFSPVPMWAQRQWAAVGVPGSAHGCLFSYRFSEEELPEELQLATRHLWLAEFASG